MPAQSVINVSLAVDRSPTATTTHLIDEQGNEPEKLLRALSKEFAQAAGAVRSSRVSVRVDSATDGVTNKVLDRATPTITITFANITAGETIVIGNVTLTWAAAAANENEVTIGANLAAATTNLTAAINVHSKLAKIFVATGVTATGVVTVAYCGDPRIGDLIGLSETGDAVQVSASSFASDTTKAASSDSVTFRKGL